MSFFSRFFATRPDVSRPDPEPEVEPQPGTPAFDELMCLQPAQRRALLALVRLACAHLPAQTADAVGEALAAAMQEGGDADEVLVSFLPEGPLAEVKPAFFLCAEPRRLREARESFERFRAAFGIVAPLPREALEPSGGDVAAAVAAFGDLLLRHGVHPLHLATVSDSWCLMGVASASATEAARLAEACGLAVRTHEAFRRDEAGA